MPKTLTAARPNKQSRQDQLASTWEEIGFAEFPIVTTSLKRPAVDTLTFVERLANDDQGRPISRSWKMVGSKEYGLPRLPDLDIFMAILKLLEQHGYEKKLVICTANEICEIAGIARGGQTYSRIREAMIRFQTTNYVAENHFIDPKTGTRVVSEGWDIITDHRIVADRVGGRSADGLPPSYFAVSNPFLSRLRHGKVKPIDLALWRQLPLGLAKPMFHYLDKNLYQKGRHEVGLRKLSQRIGLTGVYDLAQLKRLCGRPLSTLVTKQFLKDFRFEQSKMPEDPWKLVVFPGPRARGSIRVAGSDASGPQRIADNRITKNSTYLEADTDRPKNVYKAWCHAEAERRYRALPPEELKRLLAESLRELEQGHHWKTAAFPEYFRTRMAERRVVRGLAKGLPSFEEWRVSATTLPSQSSAPDAAS